MSKKWNLGMAWLTFTISMYYDWHAKTDANGHSVNMMLCACFFIGCAIYAKLHERVR